MSEESFGWLVEYEQELWEAGYSPEEIAEAIDACIR